MEFGILSILETRVYAKSVVSMSILKTNLQSAWDGIAENEERACTGAVQSRLRAVVRERGDHFKI